MAGGKDDLGEVVGRMTGILEETGADVYVCELSYYEWREIGGRWGKGDTVRGARCEIPDPLPEEIDEMHLVRVRAFFGRPLQLFVKLTPADVLSARASVNGEVVALGRMVQVFGSWTFLPIPPRMVKPGDVVEVVFEFDDDAFFEEGTKIYTLVDFHTRIKGGGFDEVNPQQRAGGALP